MKTVSFCSNGCFQRCRIALYKSYDNYRPSSVKLCSNCYQNKVIIRKKSYRFKSLINLLRYKIQRNTHDMPKRSNYIGGVFYCTHRQIMDREQYKLPAITIITGHE